ncbi:hypothetical protein ABIB42_004538 [Massilia sp. UYP32]|uniref:IPTL-CTERM protein sorting domain-containing protein n=1 Tax=Massilia timonae CCUG 45783 TaxID=883126 RepID=K9DZJ0_9BURK|nr:MULTISPECIES: hypothetical protein [Massilia]EKU84062.1 hypothetical protein HMPREF9710_00705 [Massilia timonae CCUG 45783]QYG00424.1 hypothetical protein KY496_18855 [Massilia sp. NP310]
MRSSFHFAVCLLPSYSAFAATRPAPAPVSPACVVADPVLAADPPAWLLLAAALLLLGAGRLAAS